MTNDKLSFVVDHIPLRPVKLLHISSTSVSTFHDLGKVIGTAMAIAI